MHGSRVGSTPEGAVGVGGSAVGGEEAGREPFDKLRVTEDLVRRSQSGDRGAFGELVLRYSNLVGSIAFNIARDVESARDITQETFLKAYRRLGVLEEPSKFRAWLSSIARNTGLDWLRKSRFSTLSLDRIVEEGGEISEAEPPRIGSLEQEELLERVLAVVRGLPTIYQEVLFLRHLRKMSYRAIADFLHISPDTVESRLYRARIMIRERLGDLFG